MNTEQNQTNSTNNTDINNENTTLTATPSVEPKISIDDFTKVEMRVGKILSAEKVEQSPKLLKLSVDFGESAPRQVLSGIAKSYSPEEMINNSFVFVTNLLPRPILGMESQAMILAADVLSTNESSTLDASSKKLALFSPSVDIQPGAILG